MILANKNSNYKINDCDAKFYHLRVVEDFQTELGKGQILNERIIIMSKVDFQKYLKDKKIFNFVSEEIIHDPTREMSIPVSQDQQPQTPETDQKKQDINSEQVEEKPKKKGYFGSPEWKAKKEEKKSQTT